MGYTGREGRKITPAERETMQEPVELARELARIARENQLAEIEYREANTVLRLIFEPKRRAVQAQTVLAPAATPLVADAVPRPEAEPGPSAPPARGLTVCSPLAGVFYRAPRPNAPLFAEEGQIGRASCRERV